MVIGSRKILKLITIILLSIGVIVMIYPFLWMLITSFKMESDIRSFPPTLFSKKYTFENYINIWRRIPFLLYYRNTIVFACCVTFFLSYLIVWQVILLQE